MKSIVPYQKEIKFGSKIAEICSISLEHELNVLDNDIEGNFIVSGEYKSHELSVNKEPFTYKLPFSVETTDNILKESIDFEINDFTYEILDNDTLKVDIEFSVSAEEKTIEEQRDEEIREINEMFLEPKIEDSLEASISTLTDILPEDKPVELEELKDVSVNEEIEKDDINKEKITTQAAEIADESDRINQESEDLIINSASTKEDEFATYHIHIVKSGDTIETICSMYGVDANILKEYNNMENINIGEKIIVPEVDE